MSKDKDKKTPAPKVPVPETFADLLAAAEQRAENDWEKEFVTDIGRRFEKCADEFYLSEKQLEILKKIASKTIEGADE